MTTIIDNSVLWEFSWRIPIFGMPQRDQSSASDQKQDDSAAVFQKEKIELASVNIEYLTAIIRQLEDLWKEEENDEYGSLRPSKHAYDLARALLTNAAIVSALHGGQKIPHGCVSTDSQGGIRIEWVRPTKSVHLVVPATTERQAYIYHEDGNNYATKPASAEELARWLRVIE